MSVTLLGHLKIYGAVPDICLVSVVFFGLFLGSTAGLEAGIVCGLLKDMFALDYFGINAVVMGITGLASGYLGNKIQKDTAIAHFLLVNFFIIFYMSLHYAIRHMLSKPAGISYSEYFWISILPTGLYTAIAAMVIIPRFVRMFDLKELEDLL